MLHLAGSNLWRISFLLNLQYKLLIPAGFVWAFVTQRYRSCIKLTNVSMFHIHYSHITVRTKTVDVQHLRRVINVVFDFFLILRSYRLC